MMEVIDTDVVEVSLGVVCLRDEFIVREFKFIFVIEQQVDLKEVMEVLGLNSYDVGGLQGEQIRLKEIEG